MMLTINQLSDRIFLINGTDRTEVALTFMRFQEFYENPVYKDVEGFTVEDIQAWQHTLTPTRPYEDQWAGFNLPGYIFVQVLQSLKFKPLTEHEQHLSMILDTINCSTKFLSDCYFIGIGFNEPEYDDILTHELSHALFTLNDDYNKEQRQNILDLPYHVFADIYKFLQELGYNESTVIDEIQAYLLTDTSILTDMVPGHDYAALSKPFIATYVKYKDAKIENATP